MKLSITIKTLLLLLLSTSLFANNLGKPFVNEGHNGIVRDIITIVNDKYTLSSGNKVIRLWDTKNGSLIKTFKGHTKYISSILISNDNKFFVSGSGDGTIKVWNIKNGTLIRTLKGHLNSIIAMSLSKDNSLLVSSSSDKNIKIWNIKNGTVVRSINKDYGDYSVIDSIVFQGMSLIYTFSYTKNIKRNSSVFILNLKNNKERSIYTAKSAFIDKFIISKNSKFMVLELDNRIEIVSLKNFKIIDTIYVKKGVRAVALSPNNNFIALGYDNGEIEIFNLKTKKSTKRKGHFATIKSIIFTDDSKNIIAGDRAGLIKSWNISNFNKKDFGATTNWIGDISNDENFLIYAENFISFWNTTNKHFPQLVHNIKKISLLKISNNNSFYLVANKSTIESYDLKTNKLLFKIKSKSSELETIAITSDSKYILSGHENKFIQVWNSHNGHFIKKFRINSTPQKIETNNDYLLTGGTFGAIELWNIKTATLIKILTKSKGFGKKFIISRDAKYVLFETSEGKLKLFNISTKKEKNIFSYPKNNSISHISISSNNKYITIIEDKSVITILNLNTLDIVKKVNADKKYSVISSFIDKKGNTLKANTKKSVIYWNLQTGKEILKLVLFENNEWIKITPEGFFDASKNGAKYLNVLTSPMTSSSIDKFYDTFYRPDLIEKVLNGKDISKYTQGIDLKKIIQDGLAPVIAIKTKSQKSKKRDISLKLEVCTIDNGGYDNLTLYLNGMAVDVIGTDRALKLKKRNKTRKECFTISKLISLSNGKNTIGFKATNKARNIESNLDEITVTYKGRGNKKANLHILAIGVDKYRDGDLWLKYSKADAEEFTKAIKKVSKPLFKNIYTYKLLDKDVTKSKVLEIFTKVGAKTTREDVFIFYMAGHGITDTKTGAYFYLPVDFRYKNENSVREKGLSQNDFKLALSKIQAMKSLTILDTCNSGSFSEAMASRGVLQKTAINKLTRATGRATIVASSKNQVALEGYKGHGVFTYTLLEALRGKGYGTDNKITIKELAMYVEDILPDRTYEKWGYEQVPQSNISGNDFPIGVR